MFSFIDTSNIQVTRPIGSEDSIASRSNKYSTPSYLERQLWLMPNDHLKAHDVYPVPTSWVHSLFQQMKWDVIIKKIGTVSYMGPLTVGIRSFHPEGYIPDHYARVTAMDTESNLILALSLEDREDDLAPAKYFNRVVEIETIYKSMGLTPEQRMKLRADNAVTMWPTGFGADQITAHRFDPLPDDEEFPVELYFCPRWNEIVGYLFQNRGPLQLALDTMGKSLFSCVLKSQQEFVLTEHMVLRNPSGACIHKVHSRSRWNRYNAN